MIGRGSKKIITEPLFAIANAIITIVTGTAIIQLRNLTLLFPVVRQWTDI